MKTYSQVEGMLYGHYKRKNRIGSLNSKLTRVELRLERLRHDIRTCNVELGETMKAIDYSKDMSGGSGGMSNIEVELERAVDNTLREIRNTIREKHKIIGKIYGIEKEIDNIELLLDDLTEDELRIIELRYGGRMRKKVSYEEMEMLIPMGKSTIQRKHKEIIYYLTEEMK